MTAIVNKVLSMNEKVRQATDSYIDDIIVNEDIVSAEEVINHLKTYGLEAKPPESINGGRILGLRVRKIGSKLHWKRDSDIPNISDKATKRDLFSWAGRMIGHYPVGSWLRVACSYLKRHCGQDRWDGFVSKQLIKQAREVEERVLENDPVCGSWQIYLGDACLFGVMQVA